MICEYKKPEKGMKIRRLDYSDNKITWEVSSGYGTLVVVTPLGIKSDDVIEKVIKYIGENGVKEDEYETISPDIVVRYVPYLAYMKKCGTEIYAERMQYTVYLTQMDKDVFTVYEHDYSSVNVSCTLKTDMQIGISRNVYIERKLFSKKEVDSEYIMVKLPQDMADIYRDGDVEYTIGEISIPITKKMIMQGTVYILSDVEPVFKSTTERINIIIRRD